MKKSIILVISGLMISAASGLAETPTSPTMGWSSWNTYRVNISDELIQRQADAMVEKGLKDAGYTYINIDDGFFGGRDESGRLQFHPTRFPRGLKPVVDHIHSLGLKAGIYSDAGRNTCGNFWDHDEAGQGVGLYGHDREDAELYFNDLGFDFIKIDFCGGDANQNSEALNLDERERYTAIRRAIDATGRKDVRVNVCRWAFPGTWVHSVGSSWRIAADIEPNWNSIKRIINANTYLSAYAGSGHFNDMDMLEIGRGLSDAEERSHFGMWCIMSSPLLIGCDLTSIPEKSLALITNPEVIAINQDPLGLQAHLAGHSGEVRLYVKDIETLHGPVRAAAIYNPGDTTGTFTLSPAALGLGGKVKLRDLFSRQDLGYMTDGAMTFTVPPHDTILLRAEGDERHEPSMYEAETAWLERFQRLGMNPMRGYAEYRPDPDCSGGAKVTWLGKSLENWMEWRDVWTQSGGTYSLTIHPARETDATVFLSINGAKPAEVPLGRAVTVELQPGSNSVRISKPAEWIPDIDFMTITPTR